MRRFARDENHDPDEREYADAADQIREVLIHDNYLSQKDIEICMGFDVESLAGFPGIAGVRALHAAIVEKYTREDAVSGDFSALGVAETPGF